MLITAKDIINKSIELYKNNWELFLKYMLLLFIPTGILAIVSVIFGSFNAVLLVYGLALPIIAYVVLITAASVFSIWISLAFIRTMVARYNQIAAKPIKEELQTATRLVVPAILVSILTSLIVLGGLVLLIIPGIIFAVWFAFTFYAVAIDENKTLIALQTSKELVAGRWWATLWRLLAPAVIFGIILILVNWLLGLPFEAILNNFEEGSLAFAIILGLLTLLSTVISLIFTPLTTAAPTILYLELKKTLTRETKTEPLVE